jgi:hypothetical protein
MIKGDYCAMSQFMLCKSTCDLTKQKCEKIACHKDNEEFFTKVIKEVNGDVRDEIWVVTSIDFLFTQAKKQNGIITFENTEIFSLMSFLFDVSETMILWYGDEYQDLMSSAQKNSF